VTRNLLIIGAGLAGAWVARTLRAAGLSAMITLIGAESHFPYERPPLSKKVMLSGGADGIEILGAEELRRLDIDFRPSETVVRIDRTARLVHTDTGQPLSYDRLAITTGGRARRCAAPGFDLPGVFTLRTLDDALAIAGRLQPEKRILVVGGGWIGLELAAAARQKGTQVTLIEASDRLCARSVPPIVSEHLRSLHAQNGVELHLGATVTRLEAKRSGLSATIEGLDRPLSVDTVVTGIGLVPNVELARDAGLAIDDGIVVDRHGRTSDPDIFAAGDVTNQPSPWAGTRLRLESWANAQNQAIATARTMAGTPQAYDEIPWFWSDQYGLNLQVLGLPDHSAEIAIRGALSNGRFCLFQLNAGRIVGAVAGNAPRDLKLAKRLMAKRIPVHASDLADERIPLERLMS
jgi:3-phenylpropionate/trans-cinnamate dioxygenase ferredoxin reductase subunit